MPSVPTLCLVMIRRPKNTNKAKLKALDRGEKTVVAAAALDVNRSTWYRWKK
ncbi:hypothetical protein L914_02130 [Phytophthora nicotianae]|uniref:Uncharacterized protein n=1 Tax=Phytophthora nicotianae TaxID=4792 RepID=W2P3N3_PHYNI|nr:hypothetical protein L914_02130 [Phytophthora nicotianae]